MNYKEYEIFITNLFKIFHKEENLKEVEFHHNKRYHGFTRSWDVDVSFNIKISKFNCLFFIECKNFSKKRVEADEVSLMKSCIDDCGAQKGIIATTIGFQSGAFDAAKKLGIGLLIISDKDNSHEFHNANGGELSFTEANHSCVYTDNDKEKIGTGIISNQSDFYSFMQENTGTEITNMLLTRNFSPLYSLSREQFENTYQKINDAMRLYEFVETGGLPLALINSPINNHYSELLMIYVEQMSG